MFKYDKVIGKLEGFSERSEEKKLKLLKKILTDPDYLTWQYDPGVNQAAYTSDMVTKFYKLLAYPSVLKTYPELMEHYNKSDFTRTSIVTLNSILIFALQANNEMLADLKSELHENGNSVETKDLQAKVTKYASRIDKLKETIMKLSKPIMKQLSNETGLSNEMIYRAIMTAPEPQYIPKSKITYYIMHLLEELYNEASITGFPNHGSGVRWAPLFDEMFGVENRGDVAVSILLEGVHRIQKYRDSKNLGAVRDCWDSLTLWALRTLEKSPDDVRKHMIDIYLRKVDAFISNRQGKPVDLRVDLTRLGREFSNLSRTIDLFQDRFRKTVNHTRYERRDNQDNRDRDIRNRDQDRRQYDVRVRDDVGDEDDDDESPFKSKKEKKEKDKFGSVADKVSNSIQGFADVIAHIAGDDY